MSYSVLTQDAGSQVRDAYFTMIRTFVLNNAKQEPGVIKHDLSITVHGFEFAILQQQRGIGLVRVMEPLTGAVWVQQCINGDDICVRRVEDGMAPWLKVLLLYGLNDIWLPYRPTPTLNAASVVGGAACA